MHSFHFIVANLPPSSRLSPPQPGMPGLASSSGGMPSGILIAQHPRASRIVRAVAALLLDSQLPIIRQRRGLFPKTMVEDNTGVVPDLPGRPNTRSRRLTARLDVDRKSVEAVSADVVKQAGLP